MLLVVDSFKLAVNKSHTMNSFQIIMRRRTTAILFILSFSLIFTTSFSCLYGSEGKSSEYFRAPIDPDAERMPCFFTGHSVQELDAAIAGALHVPFFTEMEEMEKFFTPEEIEEALKSHKEAVAEKRREISDKILLDSLMIGDYVAIVFPPQNAIKEGELSADGDVVKKICEYVKSTYYPKSNAIEILSGYKERNYLNMSSEYINLQFKNLYDSADYGEFFQELIFSVKQTYATQVVFEGKLTASKDRTGAWRLKNVPKKMAERVDSLAVCCVGKLVLPSKEIFDWYDHLDYPPIEKRERKLKLVVVLLEDVRFWIYDYETGEIFAKMSAEETRNGKLKIL